ncbi:MAG: glycosyltransferase family 4 protein [Deltaproteobacteria bacterium]|nr:glycosyltransferase family 4 protein [Deltaproteobacteria bacterium]
MRILYLSQYFPPEMGAPAARVSELAARWVARGHEVAVLTGFPNHPTGVIPPEYRGRVLQREHYRGIEVLRTWIYAAPNKGVLRRGLAYGSFAGSSVLLGGLAREVRRADLVLATSPQFLCALSGLALARAWRVPYVLEIRDLWPQSIVEVGALPPSHPIVLGLRALERFAYAQADLLVGVTDSFARIWREQGVDPQKIRTIKNGVDLGFFRPDQDGRAMRATLGLTDDAFVVGYIGTIGMAHGLGTLLDVAERLRDHPGIEFVLVGEGAQRGALEQEARARGLTHVHFVGQLPRAQIPAVLAATDLPVVMLKDTPLFETVLPSKLFEIMGCARPLLLAVGGEAKQLALEADCGWVIPPEDADAMADAILRVRASPDEAARRGRAGRAYVEQHFDREQLADRYLDELRALVGG